VRAVTEGIHAAHDDAAAQRISEYRSGSASLRLRPWRMKRGAEDAIQFQGKKFQGEKEKRLEQVAGGVMRWIVVMLCLASGAALAQDAQDPKESLLHAELRARASV